MKKTICTRNAGLLLLLLPVYIGCNSQSKANESKGEESKAAVTEPKAPEKKTLDTAAYDRIVKELANGDTTGRWPAKAPYPLPGAILPFHRIVAYYGNLYSKKMGVLGE